MKLSTGMLEIPIEFDNGDVASVSVRPNDRDIRRRIDEFSGRVERYAAKLIAEKNLLNFCRSAAGSAAGGAAVVGGDVACGDVVGRDVGGGDVACGDVVGGDVACGDVVGGDVVGGNVVGGDVVGGDVVGGDVACGDVAVGVAEDGNVVESAVAESSKLLAQIADGSVGIDEIFNFSPEKLRALNYGADAAEKIEDAFNLAVAEELDRVFGSPVSDVLFRYCRPLDRCDGDVYVNVAIRALAAEIKNRLDGNGSSLSPKACGRIEKYRNCNRNRNRKK